MHTTGDSEDLQQNQASKHSVERIVEVRVIALRDFTRWVSFNIFT